METTLHAFTAFEDGVSPDCGLIFDESGNLYGTTTLGGNGNGGAVYKLTPSDGSWTFTVLYSFNTGSNCQDISNGGGPEASLTMDAAGNLYGTTCARSDKTCPPVLSSNSVCRKP